MSKSTYVVTILLPLLLYACATSSVIQDYNGVQDARTLPEYDNSKQELKIISTNDMENDITNLMKNGYVEIGMSTFSKPGNEQSKSNLGDQVFVEPEGGGSNNPNSSYSEQRQGRPISISEVKIREQAAKIGAHVALVSLPDHGNYIAVFMVKVKGIFGAFVIPLDAETSQRLHTSFGVLVRTVIADSPASLAEIKSNDVLLYINNEPIQSASYFVNTLIPKYQGQSVSIKLNRGGKNYETNVRLKEY